MALESQDLLPPVRRRGGCNRSIVGCVSRTPPNARRLEAASSASSEVRMGVRGVLLLMLCLGLLGCGDKTPSPSPTGQARIATAFPAPTDSPSAPAVDPTAATTAEPS